MFKMKQIRFLIVGGVMATLPFAVSAQTTTGSTSTTTTSTTKTDVPANKLIKDYTSLAGSEANATKLVTGLRDGSKEITLTSTSGSGATSKTTTTTIVNPMAGKTMGYGNVNIVLAMAEKMLSGTTDLNKVLTNPDNGILTLRASGMGWGQIANQLGFKVGDVMKSAAAQDAADKKAARPDQKSAKESKESKASEGRPEGKNGRQDKIDRPQKAERPEKIDRPQKAERPEKIDRPQKVERPEAPQRPEKGGR